MSRYKGILKTDEKGMLFIYNNRHFHQFFRENPSSEFEILVEKISPTSSNRVVAYLNAEVLPKVIKGFQDLGENHNNASVLEELKKYTPVSWETKIIEGKLEHICREFNELTYFEKCRFVNEVIIFAAEQLNVVIDEPK